MSKLTVEESALRADAASFNDWAQKLTAAWTALAQTQALTLTAAQAGSATEAVVSFWSQNYVKARDGLKAYVGADNPAAGSGAVEALRSFSHALRASAGQYSTADEEIQGLIARLDDQGGRP